MVESDIGKENYHLTKAALFKIDYNLKLHLN